MTQWNDYVKEFAEKKKIAYGCAIVRNDLRKAYAKKYEPVPRNRGIYTTRNEDGTIKQMGRGNRKEAKIRSPEAVEASKLKRVATYEKKAEEKQAREKKADEERQRKFQEELDARLKASAEKKKAEEEAKKKAEEEAKAKAKAEAEAKAKEDPRIEQERRYRQDPSRENYLKLDRVKDMIQRNKERWTTIDGAKDIGSEGRIATLKALDNIYRKRNREFGVSGLYLYVEKEWTNDKKLLTFNGIDLDMEKKADKFGYLKRNEDGSVSLKITDKGDSTYREYVKEQEEIKKKNAEKK